MEIKDHLGREYNTLKEMCDYWGVIYQTFRTRIQRGWDIKDALLGRKKKVFDHNGVEYKTIKEMLQHYDIAYMTYYTRMKNGSTLKEILEKKPSHSCCVFKEAGKGKMIIDHQGNTFNTIRDLCKYHNVNYNTFMCRVRKGIPIQIAVKPARKPMK